MKERIFVDKINLTEREKTVIKYLAIGLNNEQISEKLNISIHTTKAHLEAIYDKFKVHNRVQAVIKALQFKLISLDEIEE